MHETLPLLRATDFPPILRRKLETLQVNLGYRCNQSCTHCHVAAGPNRTEQMSQHNVEAVLAFLAQHRVATLDLTGGAPELHPLFRETVSRARALGVRVIDRCNLTILEEPGQEGLAEFLAGERVEIVASLPCYLEENVDRQRGKGVFEASIRGLHRLNALGYGRENSGLVLNLVYNPQGPSLLISKGRFDEYMALLRNAYQESNLDGVMCRSLLSVDWQGFVYDCDFNQMLGLPLYEGHRPRTHLSQLDVGALEGLPIRVADHCYGCTAGQGSSCGGALRA